LINDILDENIPIKDMDNYLDTMEIVNGPNQSTHNMIVDKNGNTWIIEPGRGYLKNGAQESQYYVMTNFSLIDFNGGKTYTDCGIDRYEEVNNLLSKAKKLNVNEAFKILERVKQEGEWSTDFSMVYSKSNKAVYYCYESNFNEILRYKF
jgi:hypothetical protein